MLVSELIFDLRQKFPRSPIEAWEAAYREALAPHEGDALRAAYRATIAHWGDPGPPKPAHILANLPQPPEGEKHVDRVAKRDAERLERQRKRAAELMRVAERECAGFLGQPWSVYARIHLRAVCQAIALGEANGVSVGRALEKFNGAERRPGYPPRAPDVWLDEHDGAIFAQRFESQTRVNPGRGGLKRGDSESPWRLGRDQAEIERNAFAERLAKMRARQQDELTKLHQEQQAEKVEA